MALALKQLRAPRTATQHASRSGRRLCVSARAQLRSERDGTLAFAKSIGLEVDEDLFGFKPFAELWCGRLAMMGFVTSITEEFLTGQGTLQQIHVMGPGHVPDPVVLAALCVVFGGATLFGTADTVNKLVNKKLTKQDIARYKNFLGLNNEREADKQAAAMKRQGDFTSLGVDMRAVAESKAAGTPVDAFLSTNEVAEGDAAAREMKSRKTDAEMRQTQEDALMLSPSSELAYAQEVELRNARWAMVGFLAAVIAEAASGYGIIGQLIMYFKWMGLLGPASGF